MEASSSTAAAVQVLTNADLVRFVCAFLPGQPRWLAELERTQHSLGKDFKLTLELKLSVGTPGLMPFLGVQQRDLHVLQRLWILHRQPPMRKKPRFWFHSALHDAAISDNLEALEWLCGTTGEMRAPSTLSLAARHGHAKVVEWLLVRVPEFDEEAAKRAMIKAAVAGHLGILKSFHEWRAGLCTSQMMDLAAANGHLEIAQFLHEYGGAGCTTAAVGKAAEAGYVDVAEWLLTNRNEGFSEAAMRRLAAEGWHDEVEYMRALQIATILKEEQNQDPKTNVFFSSTSSSDSTCSGWPATQRKATESGGHPPNYVISHQGVCGRESSPPQSSCTDRC